MVKGNTLLFLLMPIAIVSFFFLPQPVSAAYQCNCSITFTTRCSETGTTVSPASASFETASAVLCTDNNYGSAATYSGPILDTAVAVCGNQSRYRGLTRDYVASQVIESSGVRCTARADLTEVSDGSGNCLAASTGGSQQSSINATAQGTCETFCDTKSKEFTGLTLSQQTPETGFECTFNGQKIFPRPKTSEQSAAAGPAGPCGAGRACAVKTECDTAETPEENQAVCPGENKVCCKLRILPADLQREIGELNQVGQGATLQILIGKLIKTAMGILGSLALCMFIYGGLVWMTARGNSEKELTALKTLIWASLGTVTVFASYALTKFVLGVF